jgi:cysteinyl-tRNA synthetase
MNITDVGHLSGDNDEGEDKMLRSAEERGKSVLEIADFYTKAFFKDTDALNIQRPDIVCKATEHIPDMIALIKRIEANGFTYQAGGNLYFDTSRFAHYGDLALLKDDNGQNNGAPARSRTGLDANKRNTRDFVLWFTKSKFVGQDVHNQALVWDSPWGRGYPGWHIECSAMSIKYLGEQFDIHAGGIDHVPIHHTNEIAQSEAATGKHPWVKYWLHNEFLVLDSGRKKTDAPSKMSKSSGSFLTIQSLVDKGYSPLDYRYFILGGHYRSQLQFSWEALDGARNARKSLNDRLKNLAANSPDTAPNGAASNAASPYLERFDAALDDDLNTPKALSELWGLVRDKNLPPRTALEAALDMDTVLGLGLKEAAEAEEPAPQTDPALAAEVEALITERAQAKKNRDFARADTIRDSLKARGILLEDGKNGTGWRLVTLAKE